MRASKAPVLALALAVLVVLGAGGNGLPAPAAAADRGPQGLDVIVQGDGGVAAAGRAVVDHGGQVTRRLPIVGGVAATVPHHALARLATAPGVRAVTPDREVEVADAQDGSGVISAYRKAVRAQHAEEAGLTGEGVTVAVVDTGIAPLPDLAGRVVRVVDDVTGESAPCENFSGEHGCADNYGHGTFVAGIIAGSGEASGGEHRGVAPDARLLSLKVAGRDGSSDVSTVLAAIQWAVSFKDRYGIRVLNLALGTDGTGTYRSDPFNYAVQRAWAAGIVVVVSAGNRGPSAGTVSKPGDDPWVVTVGAIDDRGSPGAGDDVLPNFSARGPTVADGLRKPDVVAPGAHLMSLRVRGSTIDEQHPPGHDGPYRRGSGTSMATAVVTGTVALMLDADPGATPDEVKHALRATARRTASSDPLDVGAGMVDAYAAALEAPDGRANLGLDRSSGMGSLDASRGSVRVHADLPGTAVIDGALTTQLVLWDPLGYTTGRWSASTWYLTTWYALQFVPVQWYGQNWHEGNWHGATMEDEPVPGSYGKPSAGGAWYGAWE